MKCSLVHAAIAAAAVSAVAGSARAVQLYSFETLYNNTGTIDPLGTRPDGFHANGGGTTATQDTIGATVGPHSLKFTMVQLATFSGGQTEQNLPAVTNDLQFASMDVTIPATGGFVGGFARLGISAFGDSP